MSEKLFNSNDILKLVSKIEKRIDKLECWIEDCCAKIPTNIGTGIGLFKKYYKGKWQFKSILAGDNITITEQENTITINSTGGGGSFTCEDVNDCLGISEAGVVNKFLNEQGDFVTISGSGFTCSDLSSCSTTNLPEGTNLYFTNPRAVSALTGQNISIFNNNSGYITKVTESPNRVAYFDNNGDLKTNSNFVYNETSNLFTAALPIPGGFYQLNSGASKIGVGDVGSPDAYIQVTPSGISYSIPLLSADVFLLPYNDGNSGDVMTTDGAGTITFQPVTSSPITTVSDTNTVDLTITATDLTADIKHQSTTTINLSNDASGLKADLATGAAITNLGFTPENVANKSTTTTLGTSDTLYPTQKAVKTYVDTQVANAPVLVSTATASNSATIDFTLPSGYKSFDIRVISLVPSTDNVGMWIRVSTDGGSTFAAGASDYIYQRNIQNGTTPSLTLSAADSKIITLGGGIGNGTGRYFNSIIKVFDPSNASTYKNITTEFFTYRSDSTYSFGFVNGVYLYNTAINAIRILMSSGNIASGTFELWGYK